MCQNTEVRCVPQVLHLVLSGVELSVEENFLSYGQTESKFCIAPQKRSNKTHILVFTMIGIFEVKPFSNK